MLARVLASASEAQERCNLSGEAQAAFTYMRGIQPAFDVVSDPDDAKAVFTALGNVRAMIRKIGGKAWCELYLHDRPELPPAKERSDCAAEPGVCGMSIDLQAGPTSRPRPYWLSVTL
ncbi:hypothetical protein [Aquabacter cavernae]|uniref:hypothetical protein n=1 Tax=Aquabacter cavernae TaxID=2496029 RepID=UPI000F8C4409|nr:hypothetical protein [Aquabacter cavernae]